MSTPATKFFYRLEHRTTKEGPYRHSLDSFFHPDYDNVVRYVMGKTGEDFTMDNPNCPTPFNDRSHGKSLNEAVPAPQYGSVFGFTSLAQARHWWGSNPEVYQLFEEKGFVFRRYKTTERYDGKKQAVAFLTTLTDGVIIPMNKVLPAAKTPVE